MSPRHLFLYIFASNLLFLLGCQAAIAGEPAGPLYYTDIPGVTPAEIEAIESLKRSRAEGLSYAMIYSDASFLTQGGEVGGLTRIFCEELSRLFGLRVSPRLVRWNDLVSGLDRHDIDLSGELVPSPGNLKKYRLSDPIMSRVFMVFYRADRTDLDLINGQGTLRYGFLASSGAYDRVRNASAVPFTSVFLPNIAAAAEAIKNGSIDAFIGEGRLATHFENYTGIRGQQYYPLIHTSASLATANPELFPIIDIFQKYLDHGGLARMAEMRDEGEIEYRRHKFLRQLNREEKRYLTDQVTRGLTIPVVAEADNYPVSFYNQRERQWQGIAHDILAEISRFTGLEFKIVNSPEADWLSLQQFLENGGAALVTELMPTKGRQGRFLWPQTPYLTGKYALLSQLAKPDVDIHKVFEARVGLIRGSAHEEAFRRMFPDHPNTRLYAQAREGFAALEKGEVDLVMMTENMLLSMTHYRERPAFKVNVPLDLPSPSYFGFNLDETVLLGLMDKAQAIVDCQSIADRWQRKTFDYGKKSAQARIPYLIGLSGLALSGLALLLVLSRKKERRAHHLSRIDHLTRLPNRRHFEEHTRAAWDQAVKERMCLSLLAIDIDHFKRLNDTYGHPQGDAVLREVAAALSRATERQTDLVARLGGEEFSALLSNTDWEGASLVAEKMRAAIETIAVENIEGGAPIHITVSIGLTSLKPKPGDRLEEALARADQALYAAKQSGRNRVRLA